MSRVDATLSDNRSSVATSKTVGNAEKSSALRLEAETTSTVIESAIESDNITSSKVGPTGATIPASTSIAVAGNAISDIEMNCVRGAVAAIMRLLVLSRGALPLA